MNEGGKRRKPRQLYLDETLRPRLEHGGSLTARKKKRKRPLSTKNPIHLVFKAEKAKGSQSLLRYAKIILLLRQKYADKFDVRVYEYANAGNHLHLLVKTKTREGIQNLLRAFAGQVAIKVTGACKGHPLPERFWTFLVYSKLVFWGKAFKAAKKYIVRNRTWENRRKEKPP